MVSDHDRYRPHAVICAGSAGLTGLALMLGALIAWMANPDEGGVSSAVIVAATVGIMTIIGSMITRSVLRRWPTMVGILAQRAATGSTDCSSLR